MTNLWGGLERGAQLVTQHAEKGFTKRVFLFSDGLVNEGVKDKKVILEKTASEIYQEQVLWTTFWLISLTFVSGCEGERIRIGRRF